MVDESLKQYFKTHLGLEENERINKLFSDEEGNPFDETDTEKLVSLIDSLRAVDPAVGSGAFPMRLLNRLVFLLHKLDPENQLWKKSQIDGIKKSVKDPILQRKFIEQIEKKFSEKNPDYGRKLYLIEKCIYGVDIQQIAVEIAKLRFFISLLVDEKTLPQPSPLPKGRDRVGFEIEPLPNLDFKLMQGNSLISSFAGIDFNTKTDEKDNLFTFDERYKKLIEEFEELKSQYQNEPDVEAKRKLKDEIDKKLMEIFEEKLNQHIPQIKEINERAATIKNEAQRKDYIEKEKKNLFKKIGIDLEQAEKDLISFTEGRKQKNFFLWDVYFAEVFTEKGGFDIVIGNPPYIKEYILRSAFDGLRNSPYYKGKMDIWYMFACQGLDLLKQQTGIITFIAQNNWVTSYGALIMRNKVIKDSQILKLLDFGNYMIFEGSDIQTMIMIFKKDSKIDNYQFDYRRLEGVDLNFEDVLDLIFFNTNPNAVYLKPIIRRNKFLNKQLSFSANKIEDVLEKISDKCNFQLTDREVANGIHHHHDRVNKEMQKISDSKFNIGDGIFVLSNEEKEKIPFTQKELELIKPSYTTKELGRYYANKKNQEWVIYTDSKFKYPENIKPYPNIKRHLDKFQKVITSDNKPYGLHRARDEYFFKGEKIIAVRKCVQPTFTYTDFDCYVSATFYIIKTERVNQKYLTSLLNSKLIAFCLKNRGKMQGNNYQIDKEPLLALPLKEIPRDKQISFITIVDKILAAKQQNPQFDTKHLEDQIDIMVYKLYELTYEEVKVIDPKIGENISKIDYEQFQIQ
jgi:adenine-specific DNA-methyltransferase